MTDRATLSLRDRWGQGFTLVELIIVLIVVSALAVVAIPRFQLTQFDQQLHAESVFAGLRYAHQLSLTSGCAVQASIGSDASLSLRYTGAPAPCQSIPVGDPAGSGAYIVASPGAVPAAGVPLTVTFSGTGQPDSGAAITIAGRSITIAEGTGHVY